MYTEASKLTNFGRSDNRQFGISSVWKQNLYVLKKDIFEHKNQCWTAYLHVLVIIPEIIGNFLGFKCKSKIYGKIFDKYQDSLLLLLKGENVKKTSLKIARQF